MQLELTILLEVCLSLRETIYRQEKEKFKSCSHGLKKFKTNKL